MATKRNERIARMVAEIEAMAKRLRTDLRRAARESGVAKNLERAAAMLRKRVAAAMAMLEEYLHELRMELAANRAPRRAAPRRRRARAA